MEDGARLLELLQVAADLLVAADADESQHVRLQAEHHPEAAADARFPDARAVEARASVVSAARYTGA
jgi:hypothetical protein